MANYSAVWVATGGNAEDHNKQELIDDNGEAWMVVGGNYLINISDGNTLYAIPAGGGSTTASGAFLWRARGEIWIPRAGDSHTANGWNVFNLTTLTFANSTTLGLGTWTTSWTKGVENEQGQAWFAETSFNQMDGELRNPDGSLYKSFDNGFSQTATFNDLNYLPG